jgi:hypothetical protein
LADFFTEPPPASFELQYKVLLAGSAEYLCDRWELDMPDWIGDPQYRMPELTDFGVARLLDLRETRFRRCQRAAPQFLKRNLIFEARNLIVL